MPNSFWSQCVVRVAKAWLLAVLLMVGTHAGAAPTITGQPGDVAIAAGQPAIFTVGATGGAGLSIQWQKDGVDLPGGTTASITIPNVQPRSIGYYRAKVTDASGTTYSQEARLDLNGFSFGVWQGLHAYYPFSGNAQDGSLGGRNGTVVNATLAPDRFGVANSAYFFNGSNAEITLSDTRFLDGSESMSLAMWVKFNLPVPQSAMQIFGAGDPRPGADPIHMVFSPGLPGGVHVTDAINNLSIGIPQTIIPLGVTDWHHVCVTLGPNGSGSVMRLYVDGKLCVESFEVFRVKVAYDIAMPAMFGSIGGEQFWKGWLDDGRFYRRELSAADVERIYLTESARAPQVVTDPSGGVFNPGDAATLSVKAAGAEPITYQWRKGGVPIPGANAATYSVPMLGEGDEGTYDVVIGNSFGQKTSAQVDVEVNNPVGFDTDLTNLTRNPGEAALFMVVPSGTGPFSYQWFKNSEPIPDAHDATYAIPAVQESDEGAYRVEVTNVVGEALSAIGTLSVNDPVQITKDPGELTINPGTPATFETSATGTGPLLYQWRKNGNPIQGANSSEFSIPVVSEDDQGTYDVTVTNEVGTKVSAGAFLSVNDPVIISADPTGATLNPAAPITLNVDATGTGPFAYQWRKNGQPIPDATSASYTIDHLKEGDEGSYDVLITNVVGTTPSGAAFVSVNDPVQIDTPPAGGVVLEGDNFTFTAAASGTAPLQYQWFKNDQPIPDEEQATLTINAASGADAGEYRLRVTNVTGAVWTDPVALDVHLAPRFVQQPLTRAVRLGASVEFKARATGYAPLSYQWTKDDQDIADATGPNLLLVEAGSEAAGTYRLRVTNEAGVAVSDPAILQFIKGPEAAGTYQALLESDDTPGQNSGRLTASLTPSGSFSGKLEFEGLVQSFTGKTGPEITFTRVLPRPNQGPLVLRIETQALNRTLTATVDEFTSSAISHAHAVLPAHPFSNKIPAPAAGAYTALLQSAQTDLALGPAAPGYAAVSISPAGVATFRGKLADGAPLTASALVRADGTAAFYACLYSKKFPSAGSLGGMVSFDTTLANPGVRGDLRWQKPAQPLGIFWSFGLDQHLTVEGSVYLPPASGQAVFALSTPDTPLLFTTDLDPFVSSALGLDAKNHFVPALPNANRLNLTLNKKTGQILGSFYEPLIRTNRRLEGVVLQQQQMAAGFYFQAGVTGGWTMVEEQP